VGALGAGADVAFFVDLLEVPAHGIDAQAQAVGDFLAFGMIELDSSYAAMQYCRMTTLPVSKRGTITLPPEMRRKLGLDATEHPMMLVELKDGGIFLQPAEALPVRDIPEETLLAWVAEDEQDVDKFWRKAGKA
jgi:bifunctional DNA-binding transcriptional regulator/antitoxin component of YhaV-PrlF toxin-antitoxin module